MAERRGSSGGADPPSELRQGRLSGRVRVGRQNLLLSLEITPVECPLLAHSWSGAVQGSFSLGSECLQQQMTYTLAVQKNRGKDADRCKEPENASNCVILGAWASAAQPHSLLSLFLTWRLMENCIGVCILVNNV